MSDIRLTTVYDNYEHYPRLRTGWGFSCWIEIGKTTILFDRGATDSGGGDETQSPAL